MKRKSSMGNTWSRSKPGANPACTASSGANVHVHLGLYGRFRRARQPAPTPRGAIRWRVETDDVCLDLSGPTACELLDLEGVAEIHARLGPDLLRVEASAAEVWKRVSSSRRSLGALLLDQSVVSGVGNVYRAEGLFVAGLFTRNPRRRTRATRLHETVEDAAHAARARREGPAHRDGGPPAWSAGSEGRANVGLGQPLCRRCGEAVRRWELAARTMYACEACQRR